MGILLISFNLFQTIYPVAGGDNVLASGAVGFSACHNPSRRLISCRATRIPRRQGNSGLRPETQRRYFEACCLAVSNSPIVQQTGQPRNATSTSAPNANEAQG